MHGTAHFVQDDLSPPSLRTLSVTKKILITTVYLGATATAMLKSKTRFPVLYTTLQSAAVLVDDSCPTCGVHVHCRHSGNFAVLPSLRQFERLDLRGSFILHSTFHFFYFF